MKLLRDSWMKLFMISNSIERRMASPTIKEQELVADYRAAEALMAISETIVIPSQIILDLLHNIDRIDTRGWLSLPYPYVLIQFTTPIDEEVIMAHIEFNDLQASFNILTDRVQGMLLGNAKQDHRSFPPHHVFNMMNACFLFESTSVNRVVWEGKAIPAAPKWDLFQGRALHLAKPNIENKMRMIHLSYAISLFLNAPNIQVQRHRPDPKVQHKREKKGKAKLPEYHTVTIDKTYVVYDTKQKGTGKEHTRMYPVRGHFRKLKHLEDPIWIPNHFRGIRHGTDSMIKELYKVKESPNPSSPAQPSTG